MAIPNDTTQAVSITSTISDGVWRCKPGLLIGLLLIVAFFFTSPPLQALTLDARSDGVDITPFLSVYRDETRQMAVAEVQEAVSKGLLQPVKSREELNFGYSNAAIWLHTTLDNHSSESNWLMELAFASLDEVDFIQIDSRTGETLQHYRTGDTYPFSSRPIAHRYFVFPLAFSPHGGSEIYLRVRSQGTVTVPLFLWRAESFYHESRNAYMAIMLYFGLLAAFLTYNLRLYFSLRDRVYLYYLGFIGAIALGMGAWNGIFFEYLWPGSPVWGNSAALVGYNLTGFFGAVFSRHFLNSQHYTPRLDKVLKYCAWGFALLLLALPLVSYHHIARLTSACGIVFSVAAVTSGVYCWHAGQRSARFFLLAWSLLLLGSAVFGARNFAWLPTNLFTRYAMQFGSALEIVLFSFALAERISELRKSKERAEESALTAKQKMVAFLQQSEAELEERVLERTRELTALTLQLEERQAHLTGLAMYDALTGLANRTLLNERLSVALDNARRAQQQAALLLIDLDEFKPINDRYGHEVGDRVLRSVAERLQAVVVDTATVARLGGDEFVIVLPELSDQDSAMVLGKTIIQELSRPIDNDSAELPALTVSASVGLAFYPEDGRDASTLLHQADMAMYEAKRGGRNRLELSKKGMAG